MHDRSDAPTAAAFVERVPQRLRLHVSRIKTQSFDFFLRKVNEVLETLTPREARVLSLRYGLEDGNPKTLEEVGKEFNVTRERIRQIEAKALRKLRHPSRSKKLKDFLD